MHVLMLPKAHQAAYWGDIQEMKQLMDGGADLNERRYVDEHAHVITTRRPGLQHMITPLNIALWRGNLDVAKLLLSSESRKTNVYFQVNFCGSGRNRLKK